MPSLTLRTRNSSAMLRRIFQTHLNITTPRYADTRTSAYTLKHALSRSGIWFFTIWGLVQQRRNFNEPLRVPTISKCYLLLAPYRCSVLSRQFLLISYPTTTPYVLVSLWTVISVPNHPIFQAKLLHREQYTVIKAPIPTSGEFVNNARWVDLLFATFVLTSRCSILEVLDKGKAAAVTMIVETLDKSTGRVIFENQSTMFIRGSGGFDGKAAGKGL